MDDENSTKILDVVIHVALTRTFSVRWSLLLEK